MPGLPRPPRTPRRRRAAPVRPPRSGTEPRIPKPWTLGWLANIYFTQGREAAESALRALVPAPGLHAVVKVGRLTWRTDVEDKDGQFLFSAGDVYTFMDPKSYDQYEIQKDMLGDQTLFLVDGMNVSILFYQGKAVSVDLPNSVVLEVTETEPAVKGDTATNATKKAKLNTGHTVNVPLFTKEGDKVKVDTRSGEYVERA